MATERGPVLARVPLATEVAEYEELLCAAAKIQAAGEKSMRKAARLILHEAMADVKRERRAEEPVSAPEPE